MVRQHGLCWFLSTAALCFVAGSPAETSRLQVVKDPSQQALQQQVEEANSLRAQTDEARLLAASRRATLAHSRSEVTSLQAQATELMNVIGPSPDQLHQLCLRESALAEQEAQIARQVAELARRSDTKLKQSPGYAALAEAGHRTA